MLRHDFPGIAKLQADLPGRRPGLAVAPAPCP
jgi:hypothetical protein